MFLFMYCLENKENEPSTICLPLVLLVLSESYVPYFLYFVRLDVAYVMFYYPGWYTIIALCFIAFEVER